MLLQNNRICRNVRGLFPELLMGFWVRVFVRLGEPDFNTALDWVKPQKKIVHKITLSCIKRRYKLT